MSKLSIVPVVLVGLFSSAAGLAQTFGEITGVVEDSSGAVLPNALVTVTNLGTNFTRSVSTNSAGTYTFPALLPGRYNVRAEIAGFQPEVRTGVELQVQQTARALIST